MWQGIYERKLYNEGVQKKNIDTCWVKKIVLKNYVTKKQNEEIKNENIINLYNFHSSVVHDYYAKVIINNEKEEGQS